MKWPDVLYLTYNLPNYATLLQRLKFLYRIYTKSLFHTQMKLMKKNANWFNWKRITSCHLVRMTSKNFHYSTWSWQKVSWQICLRLNLPWLLLSSNNKSHLLGDSSVLEAWLFLLCNLGINVLFSWSEKSLPLEVHIMSSASLELSAAADPIKKNCKVLDCYTNVIVLIFKNFIFKLYYFWTRKKLSVLSPGTRDQYRSINSYAFLIPTCIIFILVLHNKR